MPQIFGLDIATILKDAIDSAGGLLPVLLIRTVSGDRDPDDLLAAPKTTTVRHPGSGFLENRTDKYRDGTLVREGGEFISIMGASLPSGIEPEPEDQIVIEDSVYRVTAITGRDPAAALFEMSVALIGKYVPEPVIPVTPGSGRAGSFTQEFSNEFDVYVPEA